jgi:hypothetical protein
MPLFLLFINAKNDILTTLEEVPRLHHAAPIRRKHKNL